MLHKYLTDSTPSRNELLSFPASQGRTINIPEEIGTKYNTFGILLLKDQTGAMVEWDCAQAPQRPCPDQHRDTAEVGSWRSRGRAC